MTSRGGRVKTASMDFRPRFFVGGIFAILTILTLLVSLVHT